MKSEVSEELQKRINVGTHGIENNKKKKKETFFIHLFFFFCLFAFIF